MGLTPINATNFGWMRCVCCSPAIHTQTGCRTTNHLSEEFRGKFDVSSVHSAHKTLIVEHCQLIDPLLENHDHFPSLVNSQRAEPAISVGHPQWLTNIPTAARKSHKDLRFAKHRRPCGHADNTHTYTLTERTPSRETPPLNKITEVKDRSDPRCHQSYTKIMTRCAATKINLNTMPSTSAPHGSSTSKNNLTPSTATRW